MARRSARARSCGQFVDPTEQRLAAATVISTAIVGEVTIYHRNNVGDSNSTRHPVSRDTPEHEG